jgi:hypothetical protein
MSNAYRDNQHTGPTPPSGWVARAVTLMARKHKSDPPPSLWDLDEPKLKELKDLGFDDEDSDEEITSITARAIIKDQKGDRDDDSITSLVLLRYMSHMKRAHHKRLLRLERLAFACVVVVSFVITALEVWHSLHK